MKSPKLFIFKHTQGCDNLIFLMQKYAENALKNTTGTLNTAKINWKGTSALCFSLTQATLGNGGLDIIHMTFWTLYTLLVKFAHTFYSASSLTVHKPSWKNPLDNIFHTVLYFLLLMAFRARVVNTTLTTFLGQNYYSWSCQLQLCHGSLKINGYAATWWDS